MTYNVLSGTLSLYTTTTAAVSYDPLTYSRHNAGNRSAKVGHEIKAISWPGIEHLQRV